MGAGLPVGPLGPAGVVVFDAEVCGYRLDGALLHCVQVHGLGGGTATLEALGPGGWGPVVDVLTGKASFAEGDLAAVVGAPSAVRVKFSGTGRASLVSHPAKGALWMAVQRAVVRVIPPAPPVLPATLNLVLNLVDSPPAAPVVASTLNLVLNLVDSPPAAPVVASTLNLVLNLVDSPPPAPASTLNLVLNLVA